MYQVYNPRKKAWVKVKKMANGRTRFTDVKQKNPTEPFSGVPIKRKK